MKRFFEQVFQRPVSALVSGFELWTKRLQGNQRFDGIVSRVVHTLSRPQVSDTNNRAEDDEKKGFVFTAVAAEAQKTNAVQEANSVVVEKPQTVSIWERIETEIAGANSLRVSSVEKHDSEENIKMDRDLHDDMLKLVRYKILFVKREYEHAFNEREDLVAENMDGTAFSAWKTAEFIQSLSNSKTEVPEKWGDYPPDDKRYRDGDILKGLPDEDKKYLRVYYEVLDRYPREKFKHEEQQIEVLRDIRSELKEISKGKTP